PMEPESLNACLAARAAGVKARTCHGNPSGRNWWWKSLTSTCREVVSATWRSSADGERTKRRPTVPTRNSKSFRRRSWQRSTLKVAEAAAPTGLASFTPIPAIRASDHHLGQEFPATVEALRAHDGDWLGCGSRSMTCLAWSRPERHLPPGNRRSPRVLPSIFPGPPAPPLYQ